MKKYTDDSTECQARHRRKIIFAPVVAGFDKIEAFVRPTEQGANQLLISWEEFLRACWMSLGGFVDLPHGPDHAYHSSFHVLKPTKMCPYYQWYWKLHHSPRAPDYQRVVTVKLRGYIWDRERGRPSKSLPAQLRRPTDSEPPDEQCFPPACMAQMRYGPPLARLQVTNSYPAGRNISNQDRWKMRRLAKSEPWVYNGIVLDLFTQLYWLNLAFSCVEVRLDTMDEYGGEALKKHLLKERLQLPNVCHYDIKARRHAMGVSPRDYVQHYQGLRSKGWRDNRSDRERARGGRIQLTAYTDRIPPRNTPRLFRDRHRIECRFFRSMLRDVENRPDVTDHIALLEATLFEAARTFRFRLIDLDGLCGKYGIQDPALQGKSTIVQWGILREKFNLTSRQIHAFTRKATVPHTAVFLADQGFLFEGCMIKICLNTGTARHISAFERLYDPLFDIASNAVSIPHSETKQRRPSTETNKKRHLENAGRKLSELVQSECKPPGNP